MIMRLRPGTKVSALDFASFQMTVYKNHDRLRKHVTTIEAMTSKLTGKDVAPGVSPPPLADLNKQDLAQEPSNKISMSTLPQLEKTSEQEILAELQRRLGMTINVNGGGLAEPGQENTTAPTKIVDAFQTQLPGLPDTQAWSKETYTC
jgi:hypothetical protein